jgi:hypothetical protein
MIQDKKSDIAEAVEQLEAAAKSAAYSSALVEAAPLFSLIENAADFREIRAAAWALAEALSFKAANFRERATENAN